jgi:hypothetical protein
MKIHSFEAFVFQINLVDCFAFFDNRGKIFADIFNFSDEKSIENSDTLNIVDENAKYSVNPWFFSMKLNTEKLNNIIINNQHHQITNHINFMNKKFTEKTKEISKLLQIECISRLACRFIVNFSDINQKNLKTIFNITENILAKNPRIIEKTIILSGSNLKVSYDNTKKILKVDIDNYINGKIFSIHETTNHYNKILTNFQENIFKAENLIEEFL